MKANKLRPTGLKIGKTELIEGDTIRFKYKDHIEPGGFGYIYGVIVFENGCFVVKEPNFKHYNWAINLTRPDLLYNWLKLNRCKIVKPLKNGRAVCFV